MEVFKLNCKSTNTLLSAYLDRELGSEETTAIRQHLRDCDSCAQEFAFLQSVKETISSLPEEGPAPEFSQRLKAAVFSGVKLRKPPVWVRLRTATLVATAAGLGAFMALRYAEEPVLSENENLAAKSVPYDIARDQAYSAGGDPLNGHFPVMPASHDLD